MSMNPYVSRINRVIDYIDSHLADPLSLEELADIACFSPFHFHRIFFASTGERLFQYIQRIRLEKAALLLRSNPHLSVTLAGMNCGFSNPASFSRAFRARFNTSPSFWRKNSTLPSFDRKKVVITEGKGGESISPWESFIDYHQGVQLWRMRKGDQERLVEVGDFPSLRLFYTRYTGPYQGDGKLFSRLWSKLYRWAGAHDLIEKNSRFLAIYHDDPELTEEELLRVTLAFSSNKVAAVEGEFGQMELSGGKYARAKFRLNEREYGRAWAWVYRDWLPQSGYLPDDRPSFELFPSQEGPDEEGRIAVEICVPLIAAP